MSSALANLLINTATAASRSWGCGFSAWNRVVRLTNTCIDTASSASVKFSISPSLLAAFIPRADCLRPISSLLASRANTDVINPDKGFSGCGFELIAGLKVELGLDRVDLVGGNGRDDVNEGVDDGSMLGKVEG